MQRVKTATAVTSRPAYTETGAPGYFTSGDAVAAIPATVPGAQWFNQIQEEILNAIKAGGLTPDATRDDQLAAAIAQMIAAKAVTIGEASETVAGIIKLATAQQMSTAASGVAVTPDKLGTAALLNAGTAANQLLQLNSAGALPVVSAANVTGIFGQGQAWANVTASRAVDTYYTNNTGRPIIVSIRANAGTTASVVGLVSSDGVAVSFGPGFASTTILPLSLLVPNGFQYRLGATTGSVTFYDWMEYR